MLSRFLLLCGVVLLSACADQAEDSAARHPGEVVYENYCFSCHTPGLSGAPRLGDNDGWAPRAAKGMDLLLQTTKQGLGAMPAMGLCSTCTDEQLRQSIDYMLINSQ